MYRRHLHDRLDHSLRHFPVVMLVGARQVGKSTLAKALSTADWPARYLTLDDRTVLDAALADPDGFIRQAGGPAVIDEVQRAPDLLRAVKLEVDRDRQPGRFLLTGSANILSLSAVTETLAGRAAVHHLRPFSWSEIQRSAPSPLLDLLFEARDARELVDRLRDRDRSPNLDALDVDALKELILSGGYPEPALMSSAEARHTWFESFRQTYIERDLRDIAQIANFPEFSRLMTTLNLRTAQLLNTAELSREIGLPATTLRRYLDLLGQTYQFDLLQPFSTHLAKRLVKTPKIYAADTGMACHLAALDDWTTMERRNLVGPLIETWIQTELRKLLGLQARHTELSFWRTRTGHEVDFLVERGGQIAGIEAKWSASLEPRQVRALRECRTALGPRWKIGILLHGGTEPVALDDHTAAIPFSHAFA